MLTSGIAHANEIADWYYYGVFAFFSTLGVYNGQRLFKLNRKGVTPWLLWVRQNQRRLFALSLISLLIAGLLLLKLGVVNNMVLLLLFSTTLVSIFYVIRLKGINMREIPHLKIHLIAVTWVGILLLFPMINEGKTHEIFLQSLAHYSYIIAVAIPFDIRDLKYDLKTQRTIPQLLGVNGARIVAYILLLIYTFLMLIVWEKLRVNPIFYLGVVVQMALIHFMNEKRNDMYCAGLIDGGIALVGLSYFFVAN